MTTHNFDHNTTMGSMNKEEFYIFQPNLMNDGSKGRQEDPLLRRQGFASHTKL